MPCHAVQSSLSPGILLWSLMQSHGWTSCGSKKHLQISNFQNFTFYSNIQNANAYISGLHLEYMTGGLPVNQLPWKGSEHSGVF